LVWQLLVKYFKCELEILKLLKVTNRNSKGVDEHGNETELKPTGECHIICEPHDNESKPEDPDDGNEESQGVIVVVSLAQWRWNRAILGMSKWHQEDVNNDRLKISPLRALNRKGLLVDGLVDQLVNYTLWNTLRLTHDLLLQEDLLPVDFLLILVVIKWVVFNMIIWSYLAFVLFFVLVIAGVTWRH